MHRLISNDLDGRRLTSWWVRWLTGHRRPNPGLSFGEQAGLTLLIRKFPISVSVECPNYLHVYVNAV